MTQKKSSSPHKLPHKLPWQAAVRQSVKPDEGMRIVTLDPPSGLTFRPGQYMCLRPAGTELPPRPFSIASAPFEPALEFHFRLNGREGVSDAMASEAREEAVIEMEGPFGQAVYQPECRLPVLGVAGGLGITPILSVFGQALHDGHPGPFTLIWGLATQQEDYNPERLAGIAADPRVRLIRHHDDESGIDVVERAVRECRDMRNMRIYIGGSPQMAHTAEQAFKGAGADRDAMHADGFDTLGDGPNA